MMSDGFGDVPAPTPTTTTAPPQSPIISIDDPSFVGTGGGYLGGITPATSSTQLGPPITVSKAALKCDGGSGTSSDCKPCASGHSNVLGCGATDQPFASIAVQTLATGSDLVVSALQNTDTASTLLSNADPSSGDGGGGSGNGGTGGGGSGTASGATLTTAASPADGKGPGDSGLSGGTTDAAATFSAGGGGGGSGPGGGGREEGGEGSAEGGHSVVDLGGGNGSGGDSSASASLAAAQAGGTGVGRAGFEPDNSSTWTEDEKRARLAEALAMNSDQYFAMIPANRSIFAQIHERYVKIELRGTFRVSGPMPASLVPAVKKLK
jgi:hypothetical protein